MFGLRGRERCNVLFVGEQQSLFAEVRPAARGEKRFSLISTGSGSSDNLDLGNLLSGIGRKSRRLALVLPLHEFELLSVTVPPVAREAVAKLLPYNLGKLLDRPVSDYIYDWQVAQAYKDRLELTVYLYPAARFETYRQELQHLRREIVWFEPDVFAACSFLVAERQGQAGGRATFLCLIAYPTKISLVVCEMGRITLVRTVEMIMPEQGTGSLSRAQSARNDNMNGEKDGPAVSLEPFAETAAFEEGRDDVGDDEVTDDVGDNGGLRFFLDGNDEAAEAADARTERKFAHEEPDPLADITLTFGLPEEEIPLSLRQDVHGETSGASGGGGTGGLTGNLTGDLDAEYSQEQIGDFFARSSQKTSNSDQTDQGLENDMLVNDILSGFGLQGDLELDVPKEVGESSAFGAMTEAAAWLSPDKDAAGKEEKPEQKPWDSYLDGVSLEIMRTLDYHTSVLKGKPVQEIFLGGAEHFFDSAVQRLSKSQERPIHRFPPRDFSVSGIREAEDDDAGNAASGSTGSAQSMLRTSPTFAALCIGAVRR